jgi:hypothetical protein
LAFSGSKGSLRPAPGAEAGCGDCLFLDWNKKVPNFGGISLRSTDFF